MYKYKIFVTGGNGFIGSELLCSLLSNDYVVRMSTRNFTPDIDNIEQVIVPDINGRTIWKNALKDQDIVIHLASIAHTNNMSQNDYKSVNIEGTIALAEQAAKCSIKRFIFLSSIGVNGNYTNGKAFTENDFPKPKEPYATSKYKAELGLLEISKKTGLEVVIIRPPLVYGLNAPGNFGRLMSWVSAKYPVPLPFGLIGNSRSLVALDNLIDFIILCVEHKKASNEVFLISDGVDYSTTELLRTILRIRNKKTLLLPIPAVWIVSFARLIGREGDVRRLLSSLQIDNSKARNLLGWKPVITMKDQLKL
jgi:nucleoside-diphosphate-sugar epimerase